MSCEKVTFNKENKSILRLGAERVEDATEAIVVEGQLPLPLLWKCLALQSHHVQDLPLPAALLQHDRTSVRQWPTNPLARLV